eukprot:m.257873 g.257873  ORF g.257873 m.257873 type:complete len:62 (+) comp35802_c0_seq1:745-930(+)
MGQSMAVTEKQVFDRLRASTALAKKELQGLLKRPNRSFQLQAPPKQSMLKPFWFDDFAVCF